MRPHGKNFTNSRDKTPSTQAKSNPRRRSKNFITSCKQSLQRVTGSKPSKGTNALPPTWQFFLSWEERPPIKDTKSLADISAGLREKHEKQSPNRTGPKGCPSRKLSSGFSSTEDLAGGQAGGQQPLHHLPRSDVLAKRDDAKNGHKNLAPMPWSGVSMPLQAEGHRRSRTPRAQCSSANPTEAEGW